MVLTRFQVSVHARNLPRGIFRKPSPYAEIKITGGPNKGMTVGKTETIPKSLDPDWVKCLFVETDASVFMPIKVSIYDDRGIGHEGTYGLSESHFACKVPVWRLRATALDEPFKYQTRSQQ